MADALLYILVCLLAVYGIFALGAIFVNVRRREKQWKRGGIKLVLLTKNREDAIEGIVRSLYMGGLISRILPDEGVTVVDLNSSDSTGKILIRLKREYDSLEVLTYEEWDQVFRGLEPKDAEPRV